MEPVTHFLTGACMARAGLNRRTAYATLVMTLAAEMPDLDVVWSLRGPIAGLEHHRGWTHTLLGLPLEAALVVGVVWIADRWRKSRRDRQASAADRVAAEPLASPSEPSTSTSTHAPTFATAGSRRGREALPPRWTLLYLYALLALLSHLFLDWTNNYGLRPFAPFNPRWYAGSFVFIFEPVLFLLLLTGLLAPTLFGLVGSEIGARRERFPGRGWAVAALLGACVLWAVRGYERVRAEDLARGADYGGAEVRRSTVSPYPVNPFRWHGIVETPDFFQVSTVDSLSGQVATTSQDDLFYKPRETRATLAAKRSRLGHIYLDWSQWPLVTATNGPAAGSSAEPGDPKATTTVLFRDLRFLYDTALLNGRRDPPLSASALVDANGRVIEMRVGDRVQH